MTAFEVDPDDLRSAATTVDGIVRSATSTPRAPAMPDAGHADLATAMSSFATDTTSSWTDRLTATAKIATNLRTAAKTYDDADEAGVGDLPARGAVVS